MNPEQQTLFRSFTTAIMAMALVAPTALRAYSVNNYTHNGVNWHLSADHVITSSNSGDWPDNVSVVFSRDIYLAEGANSSIYYNMTLTGFNYTTSNHGTDIIVPRTIQWDSGGSDGIKSGPLQFIASGAFEGKNVTSVAIPDSILGIKIPCFRNCSNLTSIKVGWNNGVGSEVDEISTPAEAERKGSFYLTKDGVLYNANMTRLIKYPEGKTDRFFVVPETVTSLAPYCFANTKLVAVQFQGDCPTVDSTSFSGSQCVVYRYDDASGWPDGTAGWNGLWTGTETTVYSIPRDGERVFNGQTNRYAVVDGVLYRYLVRNEKATLEQNQQGGCIPSAISGGVALPLSFGGFPLAEIGEGAFADCCNLTSITIPDGVKTIGQSAFADCYHLTSITIPDGVKSIGGWAFYFCESLQTISIPDSVTIIGLCAFSGSSVMAFYVGENNPMYSSQNGLLLTKDGKTLIAGVNGDVAVPNGVTTIGNYAFYYNNNTTSVAIPASVSHIEESAFCCCRGLTSITVADGNPNYLSVNGMLLSKDGKRLIAGVNGAVTIPDGVTCIGGFSFGDRFGLTSVSIPDSVTNIEAGAFSQCSSLISVIIPPNVTVIENGLFAMCRGLSSVTIPESITRIGKEAFWGCNLSTVDIPDSVGFIGTNAFYSCDNLLAVSIPYAFKDVVSEWGLPDSCAITIGNLLPLEIVTDAVLPVGLTDNHYVQTMIARGGLQPYTWEIVDEANWPDWLNVFDYEEYGCLSGTLYSKNVGTNTFALRVTDAEGLSVGKTFILEVQDKNHSPVIESWTPNERGVTVRVGETIVFSMEAFDPDGDELRIGWQLEDENGAYMYLLPTDELGNVSFTANEEGLFEVWCWASDGFHDIHPAHSWSLSVVSADTPLVCTNLPHAVEGIYYETQLTATGGTEPYTWAMAGDSYDWMDAWLDEDGLFDWMSDGWATSQYHEFPVTVTDAEGRSTTQWISIYLESNPNERPIIDSFSPEWGYSDGATTPIGKAIVFSVEAHDPEGEPLTFIWELDNEELQETGSALSWTPNRADIGSHYLYAGCSDGERTTWARPWVFKVVTTNVLSADITLPVAVVGEAYSASFSVSGGTEPYVWSAPEYAMSREASSFAEVGTAQSWDGDDECWRVALPFSFPFYGQTYDAIYVSDNGTICLDGEYSEYLFDESDFKSHALIAPLWADIDGRLQTVFVDSSAADAITIRWATHYWGDGDGDLVEFSATLRVDGEIRFAYGEEATSGAVGISAGDGKRFELPEELRNAALGGGFDVVFRPATFAPGLALSSDGLVSGAPTESGVYRIPVRVTDAEGATWSGVAVLRVLASEDEPIIPVVASDAVPETVTNAIESAGFADEVAVMEAIGGDAEKYAAFKVWANTVKDSNGNLAGEYAVMASTNAAVSFLLGAEALFVNEPEIMITGLEIEDKDTTRLGGDASPHLLVTVEVKDGEDVVKVASANVASMFEATSDLGDWTDASRLTPAIHGEPVTNPDNTMTFTVVPGDGPASSAFLRVRVK